MHRQLKLVILGAVAGLIGSAVKAKAEPVLQGLFEARFPPGPGEKNLVGADPKGQPENLPPSVMIERAGEALTGHELPAGVLERGQQAIHYGFGTGAGVVYTVLADHLPLATLGGGAIPGAAALRGHPRQSFRGHRRPAAAEGDAEGRRRLGGHLTRRLWHDGRVGTPARHRRSGQIA